MDRTKQIAFVLTCVGTTATVLALLRAVFNITVPMPDWPTAMAVVLAIFIAAAVAGLIRNKRRREDVASIPPVEPPFGGRSQWIQALADECASSSLVFLVGEPGVGKSALLGSGLVPKLERGPLLPIYVRGLPGSDWISGPSGTVAAAVLAAIKSSGLSDSAFEKVGVTTSSPEDVRRLLVAVRSQLGRTPCLLLDQIDDYIHRHHQQFTVGHAALKPSELIARNPFWATIAELLRSQGLKCVLATRSSRPAGFSAFNLVPEADIADITLDPLGAAEADEILTAMGGKDSSADWSELKEAILEDLNPDSERASVLPIQLKAVLLGIATLRISRARDYRKQGMDRVQQAYLKRQINAAADLAEVGDRPWIIYQALCHLVTDGRTLPVAEEALAKLCESTGLLRGQLHNALNHLKTWYVTRSTENGWELYHDYLCEPVLTLVRSEHRLDGVLKQAQRAWKRARGAVEICQALLPPMAQLGLMRAHLRKRLLYGPPGLVMLSCVRLVINPWVLTATALTLYGLLRVNGEISVAAANVVDVFDTDAYLRPAEADALERLAYASGAVQERVLMAFAEPRNQPAFRAHADYFASIWAKLSTRRRRGLRSAVNSVCATASASNAAQLRACGDLWTAFVLPASQSQVAALLVDSGFPPDVLVSRVPEEERLQIFELALALYEPRSRWSLGLCNLLKKITRPSARFRVKQLLHVGSGDAVEFLRENNLSQLLSKSCLPESWELGDLNNHAEVLARELAAAPNPTVADDLARQLANLPQSAYTGSIAETVADRLLEKAEVATDLSRKIGYLRALSHISSVVIGERSDRAAEMILSMMRAAPRADDIAFVGSLLSSFQMRSPRLVKAVQQALVSQITAHRDPMAAAGFGNIGVQVAGFLGPHLRCEIVRATFTRFAPDDSPDSVGAIARVARGLGGKTGCLTAIQQANVQRAIMRDVIGSANMNNSDRSSMQSELQDWSASLDAAAVRQIARDLLGRLKNRSGDRRNVLDALLSLPQLPFEDVRAVGEELLGDASGNADRLARFIAILRNTFPPDVRRVFEEGLIRHIQNEQDFNVIGTLQGSLGQLSETSVVDAQFIWTAVFPIWLENPSARQSPTWSQVLTKVGPFLQEEQAEAALRELLRPERKRISGECGVAGSLSRPLTAWAIRDEVLSWPTCTAYELHSLQQALASQGVVNRQ